MFTGAGLSVDVFFTDTNQFGWRAKSKHTTTPPAPPALIRGLRRSAIGYRR